jgi:hypothetical protein
VINALLENNGFGIFTLNVQNTLDITDNSITNNLQGIAASNTEEPNPCSITLNNNTVACYEGVRCSHFSTVEMTGNKVNDAGYAFYALENGI